MYTYILYFPLPSQAVVPFGREHPERPDRVAAIWERLSSQGMCARVCVEGEAGSQCTIWEQLSSQGVCLSRERPGAIGTSD